MKPHSYFSFVYISRTCEKEAIRRHLLATEASLRTRDISYLSDSQRQNREARLDDLRHYWSVGKFPINSNHKKATPYFIDREGTRCAVGQMIFASGGTVLVDMISRDENNAFVVDMKTVGLSSWLHENGLTLEEAALIQPIYTGMIVLPLLYAIFGVMFAIALCRVIAVIFTCLKIKSRDSVARATERTSKADRFELMLSAQLLSAHTDE